MNHNLNKSIFILNNKKEKKNNIVDIYLNYLNFSLGILFS